MRCPSLAVAGALGLVAAGCITPSIPIPPPDPELMTFVVTGDGANTSATFAYPADHNYENSVVFVYNLDRGLGIIEASRPDGSVGPTRPVSAVLRDQIVVTFQRDDQSMSTCIRLRNGQQSATDYCNL
jgi:YD repeat-containing protein